MTLRTNHLLQVTGMYLIMAVGGMITWTFFPCENEILTFGVAHVVMTAICFVFSIMKRNSSVYDAFWSVIPFYFVLMWIYLHDDKITLLHWIMLLVVSIWSWRLTINWGRAWTGFSHEDWRYIKLAKDTGAFYPAVNFFGIHLFPTLLVFAAMWPLFYLFINDNILSWMFFLGVSISITGIALEFFADNKLFEFRKRENPMVGEILESGLWGKMRHPNYLGEMLFWLGVFFMGHSFGAPLITGIGALSMILLFVFISIPMKEKRMMERRTNYLEYQKRVPMLIPRLWKN